jgi:hypothetical protein
MELAGKDIGGKLEKRKVIKEIIGRDWMSSG